jgi:squalene-associated FAD-dependent desaturase
VLLGCYTETFAFLRALGTADLVRMQRSLAVTMIDRAGRRSRLECPALPPPLHLVAGVLDWEALPWRDRLSVLRMRTPLALARRELRHGAQRRAASPGETVENWLIRNGQTAPLQELLWEPLALAALNQHPGQAAAPVFARVLAEMFSTDPAAAAIGLPAVRLHDLYAEPARRFIEARRGAVKTGVRAAVHLGETGRLAVKGDVDYSAAVVVCAVPWHAFGAAFVNPTPLIARVSAQAGRMRSSPIVTVNLWFDRAVLDEPFLGLPGRSMQWAFDTRHTFGEGASHLSLVASGAAERLNQSNDELVSHAQAEILDALPEARRARLLRATVIREPQATFSLAPGEPPRPNTETDVRGLFLAGDWIDTGLPATIESAVRAGHRAAAAAIAS